MSSSHTSFKTATVDELLSYHDERFIDSAYHTLLGRAPDADGMHYYLGRLRAGTSKIEILAQICRSTEGKSRPVNVTGLNEAIRLYQCLKVPLLGALLRFIGVNQTARDTYQLLRVIENKLHMLDVQIQQRFAEMDSTYVRIEKLFEFQKINLIESNKGNAQNHMLMAQGKRLKPHGEAEKFQPGFDKEWYLSQYPDVAASGMDPYEHFIRYGISEGRCAAFDRDWYLGQYQDVETSGVDPYEHYIRYGQSEGRYPAFNREWYLSQYPDVRAAGLDPLYHYIQHGKAEGRYPVRCDRALRNDYAEWIRRFDTLSDQARITMRAQAKTYNHKPLISVVMPVYNPNPAWLEEAIESIRQQIYPVWELCIADDASTDPEIGRILRRFAQLDKRIKVVFRDENGHISAASNSALKLVQGEWIALLDHDDLLPEHALFWVTDSINKHPESRMIYSDEDKLFEHGGRADPYFKCEWNPDLFYSHNMFSHLGVYHADLVREVGGFRVGLEGSQDYDLALRCIERIDAKQIHHIPRVLYHWRVHAESTAQSSDAKPYAMIAGERAINDHLVRRGVDATAGLIVYGYRVRYALPEILPLVSLIIPTYNGLELIQLCVESILEKTTYSNYEILIVDNGSDDPATLKYLDCLARSPNIRVVRDNGPFNYSSLNNTAVRLARGEIVGLINNDIEVISPDWLSEMVSHALRDEVGAVGAKLWYPDDTLQHGGVIFGVGGVAGHAHKRLIKGNPGYFGRANLIQSVSAVTAACLIVRKSVYEELGGLNETDLRVAFNDCDFCLRLLEAGYRNIWTPYAELYHHESATRGSDRSPGQQERLESEVAYMQSHWRKMLENDPAYSPNLTLHDEDFALAWPPRL